MIAELRACNLETRAEFLHLSETGAEVEMKAPQSTMQFIRTALCNRV